MKPTGGVTVAEAARQLGKTPSTIRRWVQRGAPAVVMGEVGRGHGSRVNIADLQRWRAGPLGHLDDSEQLKRLAIALSDTFYRDCGSGERAPERIGIHPRLAAGLLVLVYERAWVNATGRAFDEFDIEKAPEEIKRLCAIYV